MNYLSIDIGTTGCKCQLFSEKGEILQYLFEEYDFLALDGCQYVDIYAIEKKLAEILGCRIFAFLYCFCCADRNSSLGMEVL